jgi:hypothetical protein
MDSADVGVIPDWYWLIRWMPRRRISRTGAMLAALFLCGF